MHQQVYHSAEIQAWEQRWFDQKNSSYGLMQQVAWHISQRLIPILLSKNIKTIAVCCGQGNNAGDGYLIAQYLWEQHFTVDLYTAERGHSLDLAKAYDAAVLSGVPIYDGFEFQQPYDCYIDALFGIGLSRNLDEFWQAIIYKINQQDAFKVAIDIPSGLHPNTGQPLPCAIKVDMTYTILAKKAGLYTGQGKEFVGTIEVVSLIPKDFELPTFAHLSPKKITLPRRKADGHKGIYGHALMVGGHQDMGGAVIMAAEAAFATGVGKVTVVCHKNHHQAILARSPNIMLRDIDHLSAEQLHELISHIDVVAFGMGLGRDKWAEKHYIQWFEYLSGIDKTVVFDADALWFLANRPVKLTFETYLTPHPGEAAKLLDVTTHDIETDRTATIQKLQQKYQGQWVLKGAGSLILEKELWICTAGNAGMGTGGMGDILSGMIAGLKAQFKDDIALHEIVTLHALAGDMLAKDGVRGLQAQHMPAAIYHVVN